jgi:hypothetical protein
MSTSDDRPGEDDGPQPPAWDAPPQPPAWDRDPDQAGQQGDGTQPSGGPGYGAPPAAGGWGPPPSYGQASYGPAGYGQAGYGQVGYGPAGHEPAGYGYAPPQTDSKAVIALVLSICAWVLCPLIPAVIALVLAGQSKRDIAASGGRLTGEGMNTAARIISWLNIGLVLAGIVLALLFVVVAGVSFDSTGTVTYET